MSERCTESPDERCVSPSDCASGCAYPMPPSGPVADEGPLVIVAVKRPREWHACVKGQLEPWACGETRAIAVGLLVIEHPEVFGVELEVVDV